MLQTSNLACVQQRKLVSSVPAASGRLKRTHSRVSVGRRAVPRDMYNRWVGVLWSLLQDMLCPIGQLVLPDADQMLISCKMQAQWAALPITNITAPLCDWLLRCSNLGVLQPVVEQSVQPADDPYAQHRVSPDRCALPVDTNLAC
jgi:hypothetical protein